MSRPRIDYPSFYLRIQANLENVRVTMNCNPDKEDKEPNEIRILSLLSKNTALWIRTFLSNKQWIQNYETDGRAKSVEQNIPREISKNKTERGASGNI